jgi:hypothetical protein
LRAARLHFGERAARDGDVGWRRPLESWWS